MVNAARDSSGETEMICVKGSIVRDEGQGVCSSWRELRRELRNVGTRPRGGAREAPATRTKDEEMNE